MLSTRECVPLYVGGCRWEKRYVEAIRFNYKIGGEGKLALCVFVYLCARACVTPMSLCLFQQAYVHALAGEHTNVCFFTDVCVPGHKQKSVHGYKRATACICKCLHG